jgi:hypothetical protein
VGAKGRERRVRESLPREREREEEKERTKEEEKEEEEEKKNLSTVEGVLHKNGTAGENRKRKKNRRKREGKAGPEKKKLLFSLSLSFSPIPPPPFSLARPALFRRHRKTRDHEPAKSKFSKSEATGEFFRFLNIFAQ